MLTIDEAKKKKKNNKRKGNKYIPKSGKVGKTALLTGARRCWLLTEKYAVTPGRAGSQKKKVRRLADCKKKRQKKKGNLGEDGGRGGDHTGRRTVEERKGVGSKRGKAKEEPD